MKIKQIINNLFIHNWIDTLLPDDQKDIFNHILTNNQKFLIVFKIKDQNIYLVMTSDGFSARPTEIVIPEEVEISGGYADLPKIEIENLINQNYIKKLKKIIIKICEDKNE